MIQPGSFARAKCQLNMTIAEDQAPFLVIREGDRLVCTSACDANGNQSFVHLKSGMENVWLSSRDVESD